LIDEIETVSTTSNFNGTLLLDARRRIPQRLSGSDYRDKNDRLTSERDEP